ncbi:hypothetical protein SAMN04487948_10486 [Halogranum amylolyticum]|uniref:Lipoprotein n=1 Tax=Halogranum amylolyticum TaxID=660520 RepID=A0A1H8RKZ0_9EURY|nr:hypothetical protein [Halogranum amylolyticum]SEO67016.1 hypothetical protein SAMN04487948_10486 [Halogranum amylolyticum]
MPSSFTRRALLASVSGTLAGCTATSPASTTDGDTPPADPSGTSSTADSHSSSPSTRTRTPMPDVLHSSFYVENHERTAHCVTLSVTHAETGKSVVDGTWAVDADQALAFEDVATRDASDDVRDAYEVRAELETGQTLSETWELRSCPPEYGYDRDGAVVLKEGELSLWANQCDAIAVGYELPVAVDPQEGCD